MAAESPTLPMLTTADVAEEWEFEEDEGVLEDGEVASDLAGDVNAGGVREPSGRSTRAKETLVTRPDLLPAQEDGGARLDATGALGRERSGR